MLCVCPRWMQAESPKTPPMAGPRAGPTHPNKKEKSFEDRASLPFSGKRETDKPRWDRLPTWFINRFYCQLGVVWADDIIEKHLLAEIKAGGRKMSGGGEGGGLV